MSPVGPEPPGVYWRRRVIVLVVLLVILVFLWWLIFGRGGGGSEPTPAPTTSPTASPDPTPEPQPTSASPTPEPEPTEITDCAEADILVEAFAEEAIYPVGSTPTLTLAVTNIGTRPCNRDVGPGANELKITQGEVTIWSSDDCNPNEDKDVITLDRGDAFETQLTWDGYLSTAGCPPDQPMAEAGEYTVIGRNGAIVSAPTALRLE
jgi:hypothetical protein